MIVYVRKRIFLFKVFCPGRRDIITHFYRPWKKKIRRFFAVVWEWMLLYVFRKLYLKSFCWEIFFSTAKTSNFTYAWCPILLKLKISRKHKLSIILKIISHIYSPPFYNCKIVLNHKILLLVYFVLASCKLQRYVPQKP